MQAKCLQFYEFGSPQEVLQLVETTIQPPQPHEILVRMLARPINPSDLIPIRGSYAHRIALPTIPGYEGVGIVEAVGAAVSSHFIGQRVLPLRGEGTWQEYVKAPANLAILLPSTIDDLTAAQLYINPVTAWVICTEVLKLKPTDTLVVNACSSAIGRIFAQLAKVLGFRLIAVTRNITYTQELLALGAAHVITADDHLRQTVLAITNGQGANAAIDSIGGHAGTELAFSVRPSGQFLTIGLLSGIQVDWEAIANKAQVKANLFHLRHWNSKVSTTHWQATFQQLIAVLQTNQLTLMPPAHQYKLTEIKEAVQMVETMRSGKGKVFLTSFNE
ncbi:zinc-dependent alcohol dehydrogenase family protein [Lysinibacillus piscis]|uniref:Alcohol dehydrogenase n=1 Tax=Lysinibacillus piscis TaxID=2518931 RepID=A0ABQ5NLE7_9BACI|nr:zinc-dependent alcohol dehydrogenase family protein [Lysinibacillus sp. KH24]GLC89090.1 alcohol dehydrogenase [Lysinibacillus sp. KH24]